MAEKERRAALKQVFAALRRGCFAGKDYKVEKLLTFGHGSSGVILAACSDGECGRIIKLTSVAVNQNGSYDLRQVLREVKIQQFLAEYELAPKVYEHYQCGDVYVIVMHRIDETLNTFLRGLAKRKRQKGKSLPKDIHLLIAQMVEKMHSLGVYHNDLHQNNIMLELIPQYDPVTGEEIPSDEYAIYFIDFGRSFVAESSVAGENLAPEVETLSILPENFLYDDDYLHWQENPACNSVLGMGNILALGKAETQGNLGEGERQLAEAASREGVSVVIPPTGRYVLYLDNLKIKRFRYQRMQVQKLDLEGNLLVAHLILYANTGEAFAMVANFRNISLDQANAFFRNPPLCFDYKYSFRLTQGVPEKAFLLLGFDFPELGTYSPSMTRRKAVLDAEEKVEHAELLRSAEPSSSTPEGILETRSVLPFRHAERKLAHRKLRERVRSLRQEEREEISRERKEDLREEEEDQREDEEFFREDSEDSREEIEDAREEEEDLREEEEDIREKKEDIREKEEVDREEEEVDREEEEVEREELESQREAAEDLREAAEDRREQKFQRRFSFHGSEQKPREVVEERATREEELAAHRAEIARLREEILPKQNARPLLSPRKLLSPQGRTRASR